jgi:predicted ABC-type ATPase
MNESAPSPTIIVLAGINGAGKTTAARSLLAKTLHVMRFVNADVIAQGLCGFDPQAAALRAGRIMLAELQQLAEERASFAFETTLAGRGYAGWLDSLRRTGYRIHLFYFWLNSADLAVARVASRVEKGGHAVPEATIRQRYGRSVRNLLDLYIPVVSGWKVYDNSQQGRSRLIAKGREGQPEIVFDTETWSLLKRSAGHA